MQNPKQEKVSESNSDVQSAARDYTRRGWAVIPVWRGEKKPVHAGWPELRISESELPKYLTNGQNIGLILGNPSGGLVDIDLDSPEALRLASALLPPTESSFGRRSKPASHRLYVADPIAATERFLDPEDGTSLVEIRANGCQTVFPPSEHSGERVEWVRRGEPIRISGPVLQASVARLAGAALLARHWPSRGSRQEAGLALAGGLHREGWKESEVSALIAAVAEAAGDEESRKRATAGAFTGKRLAAGRTATGWPRLGQLVGERVAERAREWLRQHETPVEARAHVDIDGATLLRVTEAFYSRYLVLPQGVALALALWTLGTRTFQPFGSEPEDIFDCFPFLAISSPTKRCGKTRLSEVLSLLVARADRCVTPTVAAIFRSIKTERPTMILDEAEDLSGKSERAEAVRAILNAGNRRGVSVARCIGDSHRLERFPVYSPKVIIAIGQPKDTIRDRSIVISMQRKDPQETVAPFKLRLVQAEASALRESIAAFIKQELAPIQEAYNSLELVSKPRSARLESTGWMA